MKKKIVENVEEVNEPVEETKVKEKLNATQRANNISKLGTIELVEEALVGEKSKTVKEAGNKRIQYLKNNLK